MKSTLNQAAANYISALKESIPESDDRIYLLRKFNEVVSLANTLVAARKDGEAANVGRLLVAGMLDSGDFSVSLAEAVEIVQRDDPTYALKAVTSVRSALESFFGGGAAIDGNKLSIRRTTASGRNAVSLVLE